MSDPLSPSPEVEPVLREAGWTQDRDVDISEWVNKLTEHQIKVFPLAATILRRFGSLSFVGSRPPRPTRHDFRVEPLLWLGESDRLADIEAITRSRVCPLGETSGTAMLAVLEDGRVIADLDGCIVQLAETWGGALDNLVLGLGEDLLLAEDYDKPVYPPRPWKS
jgi:hypothetical protein